jgi:hypothetical protein
MDAIGTNRGAPAAARLPPQLSAGRTGVTVNQAEWRHYSYDFGLL